MLTLIETSAPGKKFEGTSGLSNGPGALEWYSLSSNDHEAFLQATPRSKRVRTFDELPACLFPEAVKGDDNSTTTADTHQMNDITRDELNAKLETIEVKMDARVEAVSAKIDGFLAAQAERDKRLDAALAQIGKDNADTKSIITSMKTTLVVTALSTVIAIVLGVAAFNTALTSNMLSAFQAGKSDQPTAAVVPPSQTAPPAQQKK